MNPVDRPLLDIGLTRLEFLRISGKGLAGLTIAPALLSLLGCKQEDIDSGTVCLLYTSPGFGTGAIVLLASRINIAAVSKRRAMA